MNSSTSFSGNGSHHRHFSGTHYVVSEDVDILVSRWCKRKGFIPPSLDFYVSQRARTKAFLQNIFARVTFIDGKEIQNGLIASVAQHKKNGLIVVGLERVYLEDSFFDARIEITRSVDGDRRDIQIPMPRKGTPSKRVQFEQLRGKNIALVDDVVFSGKTLVGTISELHKYHVNVHAVTAAIGVKNGVDYLNNAQFAIRGMPDHLIVHCLEEFDGVSDQICERDLYPGVPYSGREFFGVENFSFPYVYPFGQVQEWASIPEKEAKQFSLICLENTIALFEEIQNLNNVVLTCQNVPRPVFGSPKDSTPFVSFLKEKCALCLS